MISSIQTGKNKAHTAGVLERQNIPGTPSTIGIAYLLLFSACILPFLPIDTLAWLGEEDGPIENAGALLFLLGGTIFFVTAYRSSELHRQCGTDHIESPWALYALGALLLVCF